MTADCDECGAQLVDGARFCRQCGAAVAAAAPTTPVCPSCGAGHDAGQRFCRSCGGALGKDPPPPGRSAGPPPVARTTPPRRVAAPTVFELPAPEPAPAAGSSSDRSRIVRRRRIVAAVAAVLVLGAGGGTAAALLLKGGGDERPGGGRAGETTTTEAQPVGSDEPLTAGRFVQLGSFRRAATAEREAARLRRAGLDASIRNSNQIAELLPAFWVIVAGPLASSEAEDETIAQAGSAGVSGARVRPMTPAAAPGRTPRGSYTGTLNRQAGAGSPLNRALETTMTFAEDNTATVDFQTPSCHGELRFSDAEGVTQRYAETVTSGVCPDGGTWSVKVRGSDLLVTWWHPDRTYFTIGTLTGT